MSAAAVPEWSEESSLSPSAPLSPSAEQSTKPSGRGLAPYLWMLCGAFAFTVMSTLAHLVRDRFTWQTIAIGRSSVPFVLTAISAWVSGGQLVVFGPQALWLRSLAGSTSLVCTFYALTRLPVADALTLTNLFPIWVALLSWPLLRQRPGLFVWGCVASAVCGVVLIQQPHSPEGNLATVAATVASFTSALAMIGLHRVQGIDTRGIVWHFSLVSLLFAGLASGFLEGRWPVPPVPPTTWNWIELAGVGLSATIGQLCLTKAFTLGIPSRVSVVGLSQVGFALLFEVALENRRYDLSSLIGMVLILAPTASLLLRRRDSDPAL